MHRDASATAQRPITHDVLTGLAVAGGVVAVSALLAKAFEPRAELPETYSDYEDPNAPAPPKPPPKRLFAVLWPPLFLGLTMSGLRIWALPRGPARTQALALWGVAQALNTVWMAFGPKRLGGEVASTVASVGRRRLRLARAARPACPGDQQHPALTLRGRLSDLSPPA
ncbi:tryptophan-rich sensory protein [Phenylobacterium sp. J367]|uniref:tryptophan-rich sensory protein n=1 Tax=Phenylobacterium sp. J367 TaxID=2898435 RepID=UPI002151F29D|nr:tryptophan-rich sensory protein [Phenylobacterium sp. J367]MCR5877882.1 tryptophan-rich sensory protein [Phenylobacterium sp. J367]